MWSSISPASARRGALAALALAVGLAVALATAACATDPSIQLDVTRADTTTTVAVDVCPKGTPQGQTACPDAQDLFGSSGATSRTVAIFVKDGTTALSLFFDVNGAAAACHQLDVDLSKAGGKLDLTFAAGAATFTCSPDAACAAPVDCPAFMP